MKKQSHYISEFSHLLDEWDWEKNALLDPQRVATGSNKKVWWKCNVCQNEWEASPNSRSRGSGCPECGKKLAIINREKRKLQKGSLDQTHSYILKEWDFELNDISPFNITFHYSKKVHWICVKGHQWQAPVNRRIQLGIGCPICARERGTSFAEQALYYYINSIISSENRYIHSGFEIDIFIPSLNGKHSVKHV